MSLIKISGARSRVRVHRLEKSVIFLINNISCITKVLGLQPQGYIIKLLPLQHYTIFLFRQIFKKRRTPH